ncbi:hypothetical protein P692DRAFT_20907529 [Suillus brevipes Sb2]|nr:hypothetical protein P692DRAFT_20907529 [Suillus brevipes Sb2]
MTMVMSTTVLNNASFLSWSQLSSLQVLHHWISCSSKTLQGANSHTSTPHATRSARFAIPLSPGANSHLKISDSASSPSATILLKTRASSLSNSLSRPISESSRRIWLAW